MSGVARKQRKKRDETQVGEVIREVRAVLFRQVVRIESPGNRAAARFYARNALVVFLFSVPAEEACACGAARE